MIVKHRNKPIKQVPAKYMVIKNITDYLENEDLRRLTEAERLALDNAMFRATFDQLIASLEWRDAELFEKVKDSNPVFAVKVKTYGQSTSFAIRTDNNISLKCSKQCYDLCPDKRENATQLTLFEK